MFDMSIKQYNRVMRGVHKIVSKALDANPKTDRKECIDLVLAYLRIYGVTVRPTDEGAMRDVESIVDGRLILL